MGLFTIVLKNEKLLLLFDAFVSEYTSSSSSCKHIETVTNYTLFYTIYTEVSKIKKWFTQKQKDIAEAAKNAAVRANEEYMQKPVTIKLFKDNGRYRDDVYVSVNDRSFLIKRGVEVTVPRFIEQALKNSLSQDEYVASLVEKLQSDYEKSI